MSKKDFVLIAKAIKQALPTPTEHEQGTTTDGWYKAVIAIANALQLENQRFDRKKFLSSCGL